MTLGALEDNKNSRSISNTSSSNFVRYINGKHPTFEAVPTEINGLQRR